MEMKNIAQYITAMPFIIILLILFQILGCKESNNDTYIDVSPEDKRQIPEDKGQVLEKGQMKEEAVRLANIKAEELGYNLKEMDIEVSTSGKIIYVYYSPKEKAMMGGDLTVLINSESMEISEIKRGQ